MRKNHGTCKCRILDKSEKVDSRRKVSAKKQLYLFQWLTWEVIIAQEELDGGLIISIDSTATATAAARKRNERKGKLTVQ